MDDNGFYAMDWDQDGQPDAYGYDTNGDGVPDLFEVDVDGDGIVDRMLIDVDYDGVVDVLIQDQDGDGVFDLLHMDLDGDGVFDTMDSLPPDGDSFGTVAAANAGTATNSTGTASGSEELEIFEADFDGDSIYDDQLILKHQYDESGRLLSTNVIAYEGETQDYRSVELYQYMDTDRDGQTDHVRLWQDVDGDGRMDFHGLYNERMELLNFEYLTEEYVAFAREALPSTWGQYHPGASDPGHIVGDVTDINRWIYQGDTASCDICSQKAIIEALTGRSVDINDLLNHGMELGVYAPSEGVNTLNLDVLMKTYGLNTRMYFDAGIEQIEQCLHGGGKVLVSVDSDEIWFPDHADAYTSNEANHAVQVVGIDYTNADSPYVILNDSGTPHGAGEMVPLAQFMGAWEDSGYQIVEVYA